MSDEQSLTDILDSDNQSENEYFYKALANMYGKDMKTKTHIPKKEIKMLLKLNFYADSVKQYDKQSYKAIKDMLKLYYTYMISSNRMGRKEFFNALVNRIQEEKKKIFGRSDL